MRHVGKATVGVLMLAALSHAGSETLTYRQEMDAIKDCVAGQPSEECRLIAESLVDQRRDCEAHSLAILQLLTEASLPGLRSRVENSPNSDFHWGAAAALSHLGDSTIVPHLKERQRQFEESGDKRSAGTIGFFLWKIEVQQSPQSLLAYIAAKPEIRVEERLWAIQRANDIGIPKADIRKAILDHAAKVKADKNGVRPGLTSIKQIAIPLGILTEDDLPGVKYYRDLSEVVSE